MGAPPSCLTCRHMRVEQGHNQPHVCMLWRIRTGPFLMPDQAIYQTLRSHCTYHEKKAEKKEAPPRTPEGPDLDIIV